MLRKRKSKKRQPFAPDTASLPERSFTVSFIIAYILYNKIPQKARGFFNNLKPDGVDFDSAKNLGIKTVLAAGLPGKYTPKTAGEIVYKCICQALKERGFEL